MLHHPSLFDHLGSILVQLTSVFCLLGIWSARGGRILLNYTILPFSSCKCPLFSDVSSSATPTRRELILSGSADISSFIMSVYYAHLSLCKPLYLQYLCRSWYSMVKCRTWLNSFPLNLLFKSLILCDVEFGLKCANVKHLHLLTEESLSCSNSEINIHLLAILLV